MNRIQAFQPKSPQNMSFILSPNQRVPSYTQEIDSIDENRLSIDRIDENRLSTLSFFYKIHFFNLLPDPSGYLAFVQVNFYIIHYSLVSLSIYKHSMLLGPRSHRRIWPCKLLWHLGCVSVGQTYFLTELFLLTSFLFFIRLHSLWACTCILLLLQMALRH